MWTNVEKEEVNEEEMERRRAGIQFMEFKFTLERGKRRFDEDFEFANEEFFTSWKSRTKTGQNAKNESTQGESSQTHQEEV